MVLRFHSSYVTEFHMIENPRAIVGTTATAIWWLQLRLRTAISNHDHLIYLQFVTVVIHLMY